ncbi:hypothetical protein [Anaerococcus marasmi]|uniref:hypothetical protein n=1 Tax=Anaerococcus marasmi TaxID=2057797 RepID=UPI000CF847D4|nr:hypothetical protein [Anaerococcus marasmi]
MEKVIDNRLNSRYVEGLEYAESRLSGMSIDVLRRACRADKLTFAVALPPEDENIKWRYLVDVQTFEKCLKGELNLFK